MTDQERDDRAGAVAARACLAPAERAILRLLLDGVPRGFLHVALGKSENTIKTQVRSLLERTGHSSTDRLVWWARNVGDVELAEWIAARAALRAGEATCS